MSRHWTSTKCSESEVCIKLVVLLRNYVNKACYAIRSIKPSMSLDVLRNVYFSYAHLIIFYGIIFWGNLSHSDEVFKTQKRIIRIIMNSSRNASCRQLFKELNILPIQSQYTFSLLSLVLKTKTNFCLTHKHINSTQDKLLICTYLQ
jgi:hypothetical protein